MGTNWGQTPSKYPQNAPNMTNSSKREMPQIRRRYPPAAGDKGGRGAEEWKNEIMQEARKTGLIQDEHQADEPASKWFVLAVAMHVLEVIKNGGNEFEG